MRITPMFAIAATLFFSAVFVGAQTPPIRVGVLGGFTGPFASTGPELVAGLKLYLRANPQILGRRVDLVVEDTQSTVPRAVSGAQKLIAQDRVFAVVGALPSPAALAVSAYARDAKVPYLETFAVIDDLTANLRRDYVFRVSNSASSEARLAARFISREAVRTIATVTADIPTTRPMMTSLVSELKLLRPISVAIERIIPLNATDHSADVQVIRNAHPEVLVIALPASLLIQFARDAAAAGGFGSGQRTLVLGRVARDAPLGVIADDDDDPTGATGVMGITVMRFSGSIEPMSAWRASVRQSMQAGASRSRATSPCVSSLKGCVGSQRLTPSVWRGL